MNFDLIAREIALLQNLLDTGAIWRRDEATQLRMIELIRRGLLLTPADREALKEVAKTAQAASDALLADIGRL